MSADVYKLVIVGGGAGGLELAVKLGRRFGPEHIILVDRSTFHIWKPSLHEVAAGTLDSYREGLSYFMLAKDHGFTFMAGEMSHMDLGAKTIALEPVMAGGREIFPARNVAYDTAVLAVGSGSNFFNTPGAKEFAIAIDSTEQAEYFRQRLLQEAARVNRCKKAGCVLNIAIVGGGATGVELAAELVEACAEFAFYGLDQFESTSDVKISLLEGAPRLLSALPQKMSDAARQLLLDRGIDVKTSVKVVSVAANGLSDARGDYYPADLCVWAAGIEVPVFLTRLGLTVNRLNQLVVDASLRTSDPAVFAMGDCAQAPWNGEGRFVPARAQAAHQQADFLLPVLAALIQGRDTGKPVFKFHDYGSLVSIGRRRGLGSLMGVFWGKNWFVEGLLARIMYMNLHLMHHLAVLGFLRTGFLAIGRLLLKRNTPRVKLH